MNFGMRRKLDALVIITVILALGPYSIYSILFFSKTTIENAKEEIRLHGSLAINEVINAYSNLVEHQVYEINKQKKFVRNLTRQASKLLDDLGSLGNEGERIYLEIINSLKAQDVHLTKINSQGQTIKPFTQFFNIEGWTNIKDITGISLVDRMNLGTVSKNGEFVVINFDGGEDTNNDNKADIYLALLLPCHKEKEYLLSMINIEDIKDQTEMSEEVIIKKLAQQLDEFNYDTRMAVTLYSKEEGVLLSRGMTLNQKIIPQYLFDEAAKKNYAETIVDLPGLGESIVRIDSFNSLKWYITLVAQEKILKAPVKQMVSKLIILTFVGALISILMSTVFAHGLTRPITKLVQRVTEVAKLDLATVNPEYIFKESNIKERKDEIGRLSKAFRLMTMTIVNNIKQLLAATRLTERLDGELAAAHSIQQGMLPPSGTTVILLGVGVSSLIIPAKEVGGDLFDYFKTPDGQVAMVIGDVSGKGVPAALFMSMTMTMVRSATEHDLQSPGQAMTKVNAYLCKNNPDSMFVTLFIGFYDPATKILTYANGGHCQPEVTVNQKVRRLTGLSGPMVGAIEGCVYQSFSEPMEPGEFLFLYTDGVTEAQNELGQFFGIDCLENVLGSQDFTNSLMLNQAVHQAVKTFCGQAPAYDDLAQLTLGPF
ncbi:MAG: SpoIIE family protein phosphatase [Deltaproteobacteria bacterium]|jgi:sigma-B regulation protein RsbU (phosphoserine phosphatase)|nr:SpoIIE family protein phosphatase [Deltaproteobacteria bacterium]